MNIESNCESELEMLATLFMNQYTHPYGKYTIDEFLHKYCEELTDDERNLGWYIYDLITNKKNNHEQQSRNN